MSERIERLPVRRAAMEPLSRAGLLWVGAAYLLVAAPHVTHLPLWVGPAALLAVAYRLLARGRGWRFPPRWLLVLLVIAAGLGILAHYRTIAGRDAGVALLVAMSALKFLETRTQRDATLMIFLGYFLVATNFLYAQTIPMAVYMLAAALVITTALITLNQKAAPLTLRRRLRMGAVLLLQSVPVMLLLFLLVPRVPGPLWGVESRADQGVTGLSDEMAPGRISDLIRSNAVAFRVRFQERVPPREQLYWRGPVLWDYDGLTWRAGDPERRADPADRTLLGEAVRYVVLLEPHRREWIYALDVVARPPRGSVLQADYELRREDPVEDLLIYGASSHPQYRIGREEAPERLAAARALPAGFNPRTVALGVRWRRQWEDPRRIVAAALAHFREQPFVYTLRPPLLGRHAMDEFLFESRRGFCEHYASAFVLLMRAAGVPARVVTGYQGGEVNPLGDYLRVRQSDAHAWAEVWLQGEGWVRVDPTAAVSPARVEQGIFDAVSERELLPIGTRRDLAVLSRVLLGWDALNNAWNEWVVGYGSLRQRRFLAGLGLGIEGWGAMVLALTVSLAALFAAYALGFRLTREGARPEPAHRAYREFCRRLARRGLARAPHEAPRDYARRVERARADLGADARRITDLYLFERYGPVSRQDRLAELRERVSRFRP